MVLRWIRWRGERWFCNGEEGEARRWFWNGDDGEERGWFCNGEDEVARRWFWNGDGGEDRFPCLSVADRWAPRLVGPMC